MNCEEFVIPPMQLTLPVVKESLRCLVHTILFSRSIGGEVPIAPVTVKSELLGIRYCSFLDMGGVGREVEESIKEFTRQLETSSSESMTLSLSFYIPRQVKKTLWDILSQPFDDKAVFERWKIQVDLPKPTRGGSEGDVQRKSFDEEELREITAATVQTKERVFYIIKRINERMDHLPPPPQDQVPYHFEVAIAPSVKFSNSSGTSTPSLWSPKSIAQSIRSIPFIT